MSFVETQFPTDISYGASGGAMFSTDIVETFGGHEQRNINWSAARGQWNVAHGVKSETQLAALIAFFRARRGRAIGFRFKDWSDYRAANQVIGIGNGILKSFQLVKSYSSGGVTVDRVITKPVAGTIHVFKDGVEQASGWSVDAATGIVTFTSTPANNAIISATFEFDVPARFDTDQIDISLESYSVGSWHNIPIVELRI
tara:strand:+ start:2672 stop:3271 length:600 start_codon:yes stop_codon:yes gene_type:complete